MKKCRDGLERCGCRWLTEPMLQDIWNRMEYAAQRRGFQARLWQNPCASMEPGWLFWLETQAVDYPNKRLESLIADIQQDSELRAWFLPEPKEKQS